MAEKHDGESIELCEIRKEQCAHVFERKKTVRTWIVFFREFGHRERRMNIQFCERNR